MSDSQEHDCNSMECWRWSPEHEPRARIWERDRWQCRYCGSGRAWDAFITLTVDHFVPLNAGGPDTDDNKLTACGFCNAYKGSRRFGTIQEVQEYLAPLRAKAKAYWEAHVESLPVGGDIEAGER